MRLTLYVDIRPPRSNELARVSNEPQARAPQGQNEKLNAAPSNGELGNSLLGKNPEPSALPSAQPVLDFIASDESLDRYGEVINASGWRLEAYRRNPVFQNAHQYGDIMFTLGKALITEVRTGESGGRAGMHLFQRIQFATEINPIARIAYGLYKGKFLNAVSVGFVPLRWVDGQGVEHSSAKALETPAGRSPDVRSSSMLRQVRRRYLEQELLEVSAVGIPANPNALALGLSAGAIDRSDLREMLAILKCLCAATAASRRVNPARCRAPGAPDPANENLQFLFLARELHRLLRRA
jgi:hypothetical protein